jgi:hypothetical protein
MPRLLYIADVPVESSQHGSALMFRALETYPADRLRIFETASPSDPQRRLPGIEYASLPIGSQRWLNSRLHGVYSAWLSWRAASRAGRITASLAGFEVEAVATVAHGFGWITASEVARRLRVPLHLIVHDDWPRASAIAEACRPWLDRMFGRIYRGAASRLCVSPIMAEEYARRYGATGALMYPSRSKDCPTFAAKAPRTLEASDLVIGYGGNSSSQIVDCLVALAEALPGTRARLELFGNFDDASQQRLAAASPAISFRGFVPYHQMIRELREIADVLFVPMSFDAAHRGLSFPSKLTDYTAAGLPLLIYAPPDSAAVRWAREQGEAAEIVERAGSSGLRTALERLRADTPRRGLLAASAVMAGHRSFDSAGARAVLASAVSTRP